MPERIYHALTHQKVEKFHGVNTMVSKPSSALPFFAVALLSWLVAVTLARADSSAPDLLDPPRADAPTEVEVDLYLDDLTDISVARNSFRTTAQMVLEWDDRRLVRLLGASDRDERTFEGGAAEEMLARIWHPEIEIMNERGQRTASARSLRITRQGRASLYEKFDTEAHLHGEMYLFPFVTARLRLAISAVMQNDRVMKLVPGKFEAQAGSEMDEVLTGPWRVEGQETAVSSTPRSHEPGLGYSLLEFTILARRDPLSGFGFSILPILLIWAIASALLWIDAAQFTSYGSPRIGGLLTLLLTTVALQLTFENRLPGVHYLTVPEILSYVTMVLLTAGIILSVAFIYVYHSVSKEAARSLDHRVRRVFPVTLVVAALLGVVLGFWQQH